MCDPVTIMAGAQIAGTILGAKGASDQGNAQGAELEYRAMQERQAAKQEMAAGSARIADTELQGKMLESRMMALAGASGVDVSSPQVVNLVSQAAGVTNLNKQMELYNARTAEKGLLDQASADVFSAGQARKAGRTRALSTILTGGASIYNAIGGTK